MPSYRILDRHGVEVVSPEDDIASESFDEMQVLLADMLEMVPEDAPYTLQEVRHAQR